jgi:Lrp/AsnC family transcriptional regulator, regulator for asnA, asnC and gidA
VEAFEARHAKEIDATDRALMRELQADGRLSCVELGQRVGLSEGAVRRRIRHLEAISALRIAGLPDPRVLGLNLQVLIGMEVAADYLDSVRKSLVGMPELPYLYEGIDRFTFVASAFFADEKEFDSFCRTRLSPIAGLERFEVFRIRRAVKRAERWEAEIEEDAPPVPPAVPPSRSAQLSPSGSPGRSAGRG